MNHFPYESFPIKLLHKEGKDTKLCWFQCEEHFQKYIDKHKLKEKDYEVFTNGLALVGKGTGSKGKQKKPRSRQSSSN
jgi:hypothetical protein